MVATWKEIAFEDDVAVLSTEVGHDVGILASAGTGGDASKHDHVHVLGASVVDDSSIQVASGVLSIKNLGVATAHFPDGGVHPSDIGIHANRSFAGHQATDLVVHQATIGVPPTAVVGKWFQDSSTKKFYVCTAL